MAAEDKKSWDKPGMVGWYDVRQLAETGVYVVLSTLLGSMIDSRRFAAFEGTDEESIIDYSNESDVWFDYAADTGDGWDATYTMIVFSLNESLNLVNVGSGANT